MDIDIQLKKMTSWMLSRRICGKNWHDDVGTVREKIANAIQDMPEHPAIKDILSASNINYYNCKAVLEVLLETEKDSKNVFGMYTSTRISDWRQVISLYEKDSCYLPEASNYLCQAVIYEIPSLKKHVVKQEKYIKELDKLEESTNRRIAELHTLRKVDCSRLGIDGTEPKKEIFEIVNSLPELYDHWINRAKPKLASFMSKYISAASIHRSTDSCLPTLSFLMSRGNVTAYEYIFGDAPLKIEEPMLFSLESEDTADEQDQEICLDLDLDLNLDAVKAVEDDTLEDIDWGDLVVEESDTAEIDWGVTSGEADDLSAQIVLEDSGTAGGVATGNEAFSVLDNKRLRNLVLDELNELAVFCKTRCVELSSASQENSFILNDNFGDGEIDDWRSAHSDIYELIESLTGPGQLHLLHQVKTSSTFVNRLVKELQHKLNMVGRLEAKIEGIKEKRILLTKEAQQLQNSCTRVMEKTKILQEQIERDISARYSNRRCNILGGVQSLTKL